MKKLCGLLIIGLVFVITACSTIDTSPSPQVDKGQGWIVLPFVNNTEVPSAGDRAAAITIALLRAQGVEDIKYVSPSRYQGKNVIIQPKLSQSQINQAVQTARRQRIRYVVTGTVNEWNYKAGIDGQPVVGVTIDLIDSANGHVIWSAVASGTGWGRSSISDVAQNLISSSLKSLKTGRYY